MSMYSEFLYRKLYTIRAAEEAIIKHYPENEMKTPMHMSMGQEHIAVGVCAALKERAQVYSSYRSHAAYLARTDDIEGFFLELYGKADAPAKGRAGSMHLANPDKGHIASSAIVGSLLPVAAGAALANKMMGLDKIPVVFFGDGATEEGVFWETLNFVSLRQLPILMVCEDNGQAVHTDKSKRQGYSSLESVAGEFNVHVGKYGGADAEVVRNMAAWTMAYPLPTLLIFKCHRHLEHVGVGLNDDNVVTADPVELHRNGLDKSVAERIEQEVQQEINAAIRKAKDA